MKQTYTCADNETPLKFDQNEIKFITSLSLYLIVSRSHVKFNCVLNKGYSAVVLLLVLLAVTRYRFIVLTKIGISNSNKTCIQNGSQSRTDTYI